MERVDVQDLESSVPGTDVARSGLSDPLGTTDVAINRYRVPPGDGLPAGLHAHRDQEEVFLVTEGTATFEVLIPRDGSSGGSGPEREPREVAVGAGEAIRFEAGEFQSGKNRSDGDLVVFALGAPRDSDDVRIPADCPDCGHPDLRIATGGEELSFECPDCGGERVPANCPECGHPDLRVSLGEDATTVTVCNGCGTEFEEPPLRD